MDKETLNNTVFYVYFLPETKKQEFDLIISNQKRLVITTSGNKFDFKKNLRNWSDKRYCNLNIVNVSLELFELDANHDLNIHFVLISTTAIKRLNMFAFYQNINICDKVHSIHFSI